MSDIIQLVISADGSVAKQQIAGVTTETKALGVELRLTGTYGLEAGNQISEGMQKASFNMREARGSAALLGEEIGIHINRHVAGFVANLPGVGAAMQAAFSAIAIIALIELIAKATEKLTEFISNQFIYTEEMKKQYGEQLALNKIYVDNEAVVTATAEKMKTMGLSTLQAIDVKIGEQNEKLKTQRDLVEDIRGNQLWLKVHYDEGTKSVEELNLELGKQREILKGMEAESKVTQAERGLLGLEQEHKNAEASIAARKAQNLALATQEEEQAAVDYDQHKITLEQKLAIDKDADAKKLAAAKQDIAARLKIANEDPSRNSAAIITLNAQRLTLETTNKTALLKLDAEYAKQREELDKKAVEEAKKAAEEARKLAAARGEDEAAQLKIAAAVAKTAAEREADIVAQDKTDKNYVKAIADQQTLINLLKDEEAANLAILDAKMATAQAAMDTEAASGKAGGTEYLKAEAAYRNYQAQRIEIAQTAESKIQQISRDSVANQSRDLKAMDSAMKPILNNLNQWIMSGGNLGVMMTRTFTEIGIKMLENLIIAELVGDKERLSSAKTAAANTWAEVSKIPVVGPFIAPPLAAAAFAGVMAFDAGGMSQGGLSMLHPKEAVLNPTQTKNFQTMVDRGTSGGHSFTFHNTFNGASEPALHADQLMGHMRRKLSMLGVSL